VNVLDNYVTNQIPLLGRGLGGGLNGKMIIAIIEAIPSIKTACCTSPVDMQLDLQ